MITIAIKSGIDLEIIQHINRRSDANNLYLIESVDDYAKMPIELYNLYLAEQQTTE